MFWLNPWTAAHTRSLRPHVGFVLDTSGNIVTNWHVLQSVLKGLGANPNGKRVARVTLLRPDGVQQTFDGVLVSGGGG